MRRECWLKARSADAHVRVLMRSGLMRFFQRCCIVGGIM